MNESGIIIGFALLIFNGFSACAHKDDVAARSITVCASFVGFLMVVFSAV